MKRIAFGLLLGLCSIGADAQSNPKDIPVMKDPVMQSTGVVERTKDAGKKKHDNSPTQKERRQLRGVLNAGRVLVQNTTYDAADAVLYAGVTRRYTWLEGVGKPLTQKEADKLPYYYRFSLKNRAGHYQQVEAMHASALTTDHPLGTYILDKDYVGNDSNREWCERLRRVGKWIIYCDASGEQMLEERAFEAKKDGANLVYCMQPVRTDSLHTTIAYLDAWGYPADMNETAENTYGSVVRVTYDAQGHDSVVDFLDGEGYRKLNVYGVDQQRNVYDGAGRLVRTTNHNCVGDPAEARDGTYSVDYTYLPDGQVKKTRSGLEGGALD